MSPEDIANRARFAGSCIGCHNESSFAKLGGGLVAPLSLDFPHVTESVSADCGSRNAGTTCFGTSIALNTVFLPSRLNTLTGLLGVPIIPDPCENGGSGGGGNGNGGKFSGTGGKVGATGGVTGVGGTFQAGATGVGGAGTGGLPGKDTPMPAATPGEAAPVIVIELPQADTPLNELLRADEEIRAKYGERTISGRSAQSTH